MNTELLARNVAAHWVQSGLLVVAALIAMRLLRAGEPRLKLAALHLTLAATLLLPLMQPRRPAESPAEAAAVTVSVGADRYRLLATTAEPPPSSQFNAGAVVLGLVLAGIALRLLWLCGGIISLLRFRTQAREIPAPGVARDLERMFGVMPRYFEHPERASPATFGVFGATVVLPSNFSSLDGARQRAIVCHELLHVKRRDALIAAIEEIVATLLWFHPWVWLLRLRIRVAREQVVDRRVIELIGHREAYVRCLVELSGHDLVPHLSTGMSSSRELRTRIDAVLEEVSMSRRRAVAAGFVLLGVVAATASVGAWAVPLQATPPHATPQSVTSSVTPPSVTPPSVTPPSVTPQYVVSSFSRTSQTPSLGRTAAQAPQIQAAAPRPSTSSGRPEPVEGRKQINKIYAEYPQDAIEKGISGTVLVDIAVSPAGDVTTGAVVSGPQELRASAFKAALGLKFEAGSGTTALRVGVEYRISGDSWGVRVSLFDPGAPSQPRVFSVTPFGAANAEPPLAGVRIGGGLRAPRKIKDVPPVYPPMAQQARVQGVVIIETRVDENGNVSDTRLLRSIPLLDQAAVDAVKQWQYTPTLLNGAAVPVVMTVTINFSLRTQVQLRIKMPDETLVLLRINANGGIGRTEHPAMSKFGFAPFVDDNPSVNTVKVVIYELDEPGTAPRTLGNVELTPGAGMVQSATTPSFGIEILGIDR